MVMASTGCTSENTFVNFSTPQRRTSIKRMMARRKLESTATAEDEKVLPDHHRPAKLHFTQYHITSDDLALRPTVPSWQAVVPERISSRGRNTWPTTSRGQQAIAWSPDTLPTLVKTPWERERGRKGSLYARNENRSRPALSHKFAQLPREIYHCILVYLNGLHSLDLDLNVVAWQADLRSLSRVDKRWHRVAREHLYGELWMPTNKAPAKRKFSLQQAPSPLQKLMRTIEESPGLSFLTHHLRIGSALAAQLKFEARAPPGKTATLALLQELILQCPNLEHVSGYIPPLSASTESLFDALSSRSRLKSHAWDLSSGHVKLPTLANFVSCHNGWTRLESMVLTADPTESIGFGVVATVLAKLPSLKHLMVSGLHRHDFHNGTLLQLPTLRSLRLENLVGLTDQGIEQLARLQPLERLALVGLELVSLHTIQALFTHLTQLRRFTLVQDTSPEPQVALKSGYTVRSLNSPSLQYLHWDCLIPGAATSLIAKAIETNGFPSIHTVKIPCDYDGAVQALCRPLARQKLTTVDLTYLAAHTKDKYERSLRLAQIQAQVRIRQSGQHPSMNVVVQDEFMQVQHTSTMGAYLGDMRSEIEYSLEPDVGEGALAEFEDLTGSLPEFSGGGARRLERRKSLCLLF